MTLQEIYEQFHGDYDSVLKRLRDEEKIKKYLSKFVNYSYDQLGTGGIHCGCV